MVRTDERILELRQRLQPHVAERGLDVALAFHFHRQLTLGVAKLRIEIYPHGHQLAVDDAHEHIAADDELELSPFARREFTCEIGGIPDRADQLALPSVVGECHHATRSSARPPRRQWVFPELDLTNAALRTVATIAETAIRVHRVVGFVSSNFPRSAIWSDGGSAFRDALLELFLIHIVRDGAQSSRSEKHTGIRPFAFQFDFRLEFEISQLAGKNQP